MSVSELIDFEPTLAKTKSSVTGPSGKSVGEVYPTLSGSWVTYDVQGDKLGGGCSEYTTALAKLGDVDGLTYDKSISRFDIPPRSKDTVKFSNDEEYSTWILYHSLFDLFNGKIPSDIKTFTSISFMDRLSNVLNTAMSYKPKKALSYDFEGFFKNLWWCAVFLREMKSSKDLPSTKEMKVFYDRAVSCYNFYSINISDMGKTLFKERTWELSLEGLEFDPNTADADTIIAFLQNPTTASVEPIGENTAKAFKFIDIDTLRTELWFRLGKPGAKAAKNIKGMLALLEIVPNVDSLSLSEVPKALYESFTQKNASALSSALLGDSLSFNYTAIANFMVMRNNYSVTQFSKLLALPKAKAHLYHILLSRSYSISHTIVESSPIDKDIVDKTIKYINKQIEDADLTGFEQFVVPQTGETALVPDDAMIYSHESGIVVVGTKHSYLIPAHNLGMSITYLSKSETNEYISSDLIHVGSGVYTAKNAKSMGLKVPEETFERVAELSPKTEWPFTEFSEGAAVWRFNENLSAAQRNEYKEFINIIHALPAGAKAVLVDAAIEGDFDAINTVRWLYDNLFFTISDTSEQDVPWVDPDKPYYSYVVDGKITKTAIIKNWPVWVLDQFLIDEHAEYYILSDVKPAKAEWASSKLLTKKYTIPPKAKVKYSLTDYKSLTFAATGKEYGGVHTKTSLTDQFGREWLAKYYASDDQSLYRIDTEHYGNVIGKLFGFTCAETIISKFNEQPCVIQLIAENSGSLVALSYKDLSKKQLASAMSQHVLDWLIASHDSHGDNLLVLTNDKIMGIDKGQTFKHFGSDKLSTSFDPAEERKFPIWYSHVYEGIISHDINEAEANSIAEAVLLSAYNVQQRHTARYTELATKALEHRKVWPGAYPDSAALVSALVDRKEHIFDDFMDFYKSIWKKAGYKWVLDDKMFAQTIGEAILMPCVPLIDKIKNSKSAGTALFFDTTDIEDYHIIWSLCKMKDGSQTLLGQARITQTADVRVTKYLKSLVSNAHPKKSKSKPVKKPVSFDDPMLAGLYDPPGIVHKFYSHVVAYAKTVQTHAPNGGTNTDGAYNGETINNCNNYYTKVAAALADIEKARESGVLASGLWTAGSVHTTYMQDWVYDALTKLVSDYNKVKEIHESGKSMKAHSPDYFITMPEYIKPPSDITLWKDAKEVFKYKVGNDFYIKKSDYGHYLVKSDPYQIKWISTAEFNEASANSVPYTEPVSDDPKDEKPKDAVAMTKGTKPVAAGSAGAKWVHKSGSYFEQNEDGNWTFYGADGEKGLNYDNQYVVNATTTYESDYTFESDEQDSQAIEAETNTKKLVVIHKMAQAHQGTVNSNGDLEENPGKDVFYLQKGFDYEITHDNVRIKYRSWTEAGTTLAQQGMLNIEISGWEDSLSDIDNVLDTLNLIGIGVAPANAMSLELAYWRTMTEIIQDHTHHGPYDNIVAKVQKAVLGNIHMTDSEELEILKGAWEEQFGSRVSDCIEWVPRFDTHYNIPNIGRPYWFRPDITLEEFKNTWYANKNPVHFLQSNAQFQQVMHVGHLLSTEERMRVLGKEISGMSSARDQSVGSSSYVFTHQNSDNPCWSSGVAFVADPTTALRHTTYAFGSDFYGNVTSKKSSSPYHPKGMFAYQDDSNEMMIKYHAPVMLLQGSAANLPEQCKWTRASKDWQVPYGDTHKLQQVKKAMWEEIERRDKEHRQLVAGFTN